MCILEKVIKAESVMKRVGGPTQAGSLLPAATKSRASTFFYSSHAVIAEGLQGVP